LGRQLKLTKQSTPTADAQKNKILRVTRMAKREDKGTIRAVFISPNQQQNQSNFSQKRSLLKTKIKYFKIFYLP
jgi:hypothetical protein